MATTVRRLYSSFHPEGYTLDIAVDPKKMTFKGHVIIDGTKVGRPSKRLTFHQKNLKIKSVNVIHYGKKGDQKLKPSRVNYQQGFEELRIHFEHLLYPGRYQVEITYEGIINSQLHGIYASTFKHGKEDKTIICTQFESHHAREALPCIDEPEAKAVFALTLSTPANMSSVISNTDPLDSSKKAGQMVTKFAQTPKMSSYLLAFIAGDLSYLEGRTKNNVRVRTYATPDNVKHGQFALECAIKTLDFYDEYFALPYPLTKCDLIALPDFASGAMENWGCITFREQALLVDDSTTSLSLKQYVANVVAHELTHQWFGNLVTMRWWTDLWLNESFASWMSYLAVDHIFPVWHAWTQFIVDEQSVGLKQDSLEHTHPIQVKINNPDEIRVVFDAISYEKGASVITMLQDYVGADTFRDGIRLYLSEHTYANTDTTDLWQALENVSNKPVTQFMTRWITSSGYPLLKCTYREQNLRIEQQRFYLNPLAKKEATTWPVPLFSDLVLAKNDPFIHRSINVPINVLPSSIIMNKGRRGFYRVVYSDEIIDAFMDKDWNNKVADVDRLGLISDAFEAAKGGYLPTLNALHMLDNYFDEDSLVVWEVIAGAIGSIRSAMDDEELRELIKPFVRKLVSKELKRLGLKAKRQDSHFDRLLRPTILSLAANADEPKVIEEIERLFYKTKPDSIDPDIRGVVYTTIARRGDKKDFAKLLKMHNSSSSSEERLKLAAALTNFKQADIISMALDLIKSPEVRMQDVVYWISYSFANHYSRDETWAWLTKNWDWLKENMGEDLSFYRMPFYAARHYSSLKFLKEFKKFFESNLSPAFDRPLKQAIETIEWQAEWKKRDLTDIKRFFTEGSKA